MVVDSSRRTAFPRARLLSWPAGAALAFTVGAALSAALPEPARWSLVGAFAAGETLFAAGVVLVIVGVGIEAWRHPPSRRAPGRWLAQLAHAAARSDLVLLGLAVNAAGACLHPAALLVAGRPSAGRDTYVLVADLAAVLLVYAPLTLLVLTRRRTARPAWPAA